MSELDDIVCDACGSPGCQGVAMCEEAREGVAGVCSRRVWLLSTCPACVQDGMYRAVRQNRRNLGLPPQPCTCVDARQEPTR